jgi:adenine-specific DNA-methyltransferase
MGKVRYLGSKTRLVDQITEKVGRPSDGRFIDLFCGTGSIALASGLQGWKVSANDTLKAATTLTSAKLISASDVHFQSFGGYYSIIKKLNALMPHKGYFYSEYSGSAENKEGKARPYFSLSNAQKIDSIRAEIRNLYQENKITANERTLLIADLIESSNEVASIAGTYGCFLKNLSSNALKPIVLKARPLQKRTIDWHVSQGDALNAKVETIDTVYIDPPYTKRQYAAYYHIPETLANDDEPLVSGITGLRPWKSKASDFCYKAKAPIAIENLIKSLPSRKILISYSSAGHISFQTLVEIASKFGDTDVSTFENFGKYISSKKSSINAKSDPLTEYLIEINR